MNCKDCPKGRTERVLGNGITEPPYLLLIRCPYENEYYKYPDDECNHIEQLEEKEVNMTEKKANCSLKSAAGYCSICATPCSSVKDEICDAIQRGYNYGFTEGMIKGYRKSIPNEVYDFGYVRNVC